MPPKHTKPSSDTRDSLRAELKKLGFSTDGTKQELLKRLKQAQSVDVEPVSPISSDDADEHVNAVVHTSCKLADPGAMVAEAAQNVINEANAGLITETVGNQVAVGNVSGLDLFRRLDRLEVDRDAERARNDAERQRNEAERQRNEAERQRNEAFRNQIQLQQDDLTNQIKELAAVFDGFRSIRERFLENFRKGNMELCSEADHRKVKKGNEVAHGGNVVYDAKLFLDTNRKDVSTFHKLYHLSPIIAKDLGDSLIISAINKHATIISSKYHRTIEPFHEKFAAFADQVQAAEESGGASIDFLKAPTALSKAYREFEATWATCISKVEDQSQ